MAKQCAVRLHAPDLFYSDQFIVRDTNDPLHYRFGSESELIGTRDECAIIISKICEFQNVLYTDDFVIE